MKHLIRLILPLCLLIFGMSGVIAEEKANQPSTSTKIGVLDWQQLLAKAPQAEEAGKRLEKEFQGRKDKLINKQKDLQTRQEKLMRDKDVMSDAERMKADKEITKLQQDLRHQDEELGSSCRLA